MAHWKIYLKDGTILEDEKYKNIEYDNICYRIYENWYKDKEIIKRKFFGFKKEKQLKKEEKKANYLLVALNEMLYCEWIEEKDKYERKVK